MTDTLKIPRAAIQYTNQEQFRFHNINRMKKSITVNHLPNDEFEAFTTELELSKQNDAKAVRHSTLSGTNLTAANLARLDKLHKNTPTENNPPLVGECEVTTITVDSMTTANHKPKENDSNSNASSTHFTMVNGFGGSRIKQPKKPVCCCNNITAVIVSMTILFIFIIFGVIIFAEYPRMMAEIE